MTTSVLLVGLGQISMGYDLDADPEKYVYTHARAFDQHPSFNLLGGVDPDVERCEVFTKTYQHKAFTSLEKALNVLKPDIVVLAVPTEVHFEAIGHILSVHRPSAILCEKPLAYDINQAQEIVDRCSASGVKLYVNYIRRSDPGVLEVRRRIISGEISLPIKGNLWYSKGLIHNGSHFINLLQYWLGSLKQSRILNEGRQWDKCDPEPDAYLEFQNGSIFMQAAWEEHFSHYTLELLSPSGRLRYEDGGQKIEWQGVILDQNFSGYQVLGSHVSCIESGMDCYQYYVTDQLAQALTGDKANITTGLEALSTLNTIQKIVENL